MKKVNCIHANADSTRNECAGHHETFNVLSVDSDLYAAEFLLYVFHYKSTKLHRVKSKMRHFANAATYQGGSDLYNVFMKASQNGDLSILIGMLKKDIGMMNN